MRNYHQLRHLSMRAFIGLACPLTLIACNSSAIAQEAAPTATENSTPSLTPALDPSAAASAPLATGHTTLVYDDQMGDQTSRRSFLKWVGKAGLATAAAIGGGLVLVLPAFAWINCSQYFPGCTGNCDCESCCTDPDYGVQCCAGNCGPCGQPQYFIVTSFWYWDPPPGDGKCHQTKDCEPCTP
jgi:hypothetical protein